jgi:RimJ/RimL family protein N-acetyltransferase
MIELASFEEPDFDQLIAWIDNETLLTNWAGSLFSFPLTHESLAWYINDTNDLETADALVYKIVEQETGEAIGHISLGSISRKNRSARISRVLIGSNAAKGKGLCKQMMEKVLSIGFNQLNLHRISLGVFDFNTAAIAPYAYIRMAGL